jgi:Nif-specific regulatory protein
MTKNLYSLTSTLEKKNFMSENSDFENLPTTRLCEENNCKVSPSCDEFAYRGEIVSLLFQMSKTIIENDCLENLLSILLKIMSEHMNVTKGIVNFYNRTTGKIFIYDSIGLTDNEKARGVYSLGEGITGRVVETGQPIVVPKISKESNFLNKTQSLSNSDLKDYSFICIPILRGKKVLGTICIERLCANREILKYDVEILGIIAAMIAQTVELYLLENEEKPFSKIEKNLHLQKGSQDKFNIFNIIGNSKPMLEVFSMIEKISETKTTVLLLGESGVGKELVADAIHYNSKKSNFPFIKFNCAALPESIIESELFGHEKGAFSGANNARKGRFEEADGGTLFIDEVAELSLPMQAKFLRVLQERTFERVGGNKPINVDIRIIAATNRDLFNMVNTGTFREDLFYRLNVFPIMIPQLKKRGSDIITIAEHFIAKFSKHVGKDVKRISTTVQEMLLAYPWPGNVRELENVIERAVILSEDNVIHGYDLPLSLQTPVLKKTSLKHGLIAKLDSVEYEMLVDALYMHSGNISAASEELELSRRMLGIRMKKFGLNYRKFKRK